MYVYMGFSSSTRGKEPGCPCIRDAGSVSGLGRSPGGGHGNPLRYPCLENPVDRGAWWSTVHGVAKSWTRLKQLSAHTHTHRHTHTLILLPSSWYASSPPANPTLSHKVLFLLALETNELPIGESCQILLSHGSI